MKRLVVLGSVTLMALAPAAMSHAGEPDAATPTISAQALGTLDAIFQTCQDLNPDAAKRYQERAASMTQGTRAETLADVRRSDEYRQAFDSVSASAGQADRTTTLRACADYLTMDK